MKRAIVVYSLTAILLLTISSCLESDLPCREFAKTHEQIASTAWQVDTFRMYVNDSTNGIFLDTVFVNDGEWRFIMNANDWCSYKGLMVFERKNGEDLVFNYTLGSDGNGLLSEIDLLLADTTLHPDGYYTPYSQNTCAAIWGGRLLIPFQTKPWCNGNYGKTRFWSFVLSPKQ